MLGYLIDMDGVIYRGSQLIPGAEKFIRELQDADVPFLFLTNNSQRTRRDVVTRLSRMGIDVEESHVFTCSMATARYLAQLLGVPETAIVDSSDSSQYDIVVILGADYKKQ